MVMNCQILGIVVIGFSLWACESKEGDDAAQNGSVLSSTRAAGPSTSHDFSVDTKASKLKVTMNAELEKIQALNRTGLSGGLRFAPGDLHKCEGQIRFDLLELELVHATARGESGDFGEMLASRKQNDDMRVWLEISSDTPPETLAEYRYATFEWRGVRAATPAVVPEVPGRHVIDMEVAGRLSLHGKLVDRVVSLQLTVERSQQRVTSLEVATKKPLVVMLEEHDVRPRSAFGVLADRTLEAMGKKVAKEPEIDVFLLLRPRTPSSNHLGK